MSAPHCQAMPMTVCVETSRLQSSRQSSRQEHMTADKRGVIPWGFLILAVLMCACAMGHALKTVFAGFLLERVI